MTVSTISPTPTRLPGGVTTDFDYQPLANMGLPDPISYNTIFDDFNGALNPNLWTKYLKSSGTVAAAAGDGGRMLFTTAATSGDVVALQPPVGVMSLVQGKKQFFAARLQMSSIAATGPTVIAGLLDVTATPNLTITDGIYFSINNGIATLNIVDAATSTTTAVVIPTAAYATQATPTAVAMAAATDYDMAFYVNSKQDVLVWFGQQLFGYLPQSGSGVANVSGYSLAPALGPCAGYRQSTAALTLTSVLLAPTLVLEEGTGAAAVTMNADFVLAAKER